MVNLWSLQIHHSSLTFDDEDKRGETLNGASQQKLNRITKR